VEEQDASGFDHGRPSFLPSPPPPGVAAAATAAAATFAASSATSLGVRVGVTLLCCNNDSVRMVLM